MNTPAMIPFSQVPQGGVISDGQYNWYMNIGNSSTIDLANGNLTTGISPTELFYYWPSATLVIE